MPPDVLFETHSLTVTYGGLRANNEISLKVHDGQIVGLIGPNGAGKTTLVDAVTGFTPYYGNVSLSGTSIDGLKPHQRARRGLSRTWQSLELFDDLTAIENLLVATRRVTVSSVIADVVSPRRRRDESSERWALSLMGLDELRDRSPRQLSLGQGKLLGVARAIATRPKVVLLDEPAAGLDPTESATLGNHLHSVVQEGIAVLLIDHDMDLVLDVCDYVYVLEFGRLIAEGQPSVVRANEDVIAAYLGEAERRRAAEGVGAPADRAGQEHHA
jgi:ABC-type branched-subunit amino acid transport system ATPase component